jgi:Plavaka transposase
LRLEQQTASAPPEPSSESLADRRPRRLNRRLPARFRDELPHSIPSLPSQVTAPNDAGFQTPLPSGESHDISPHLSPGSRPTISHRQPVEYNSPCNVFGLFRKYKTVHLPIHDPEENIALAELSDIPSQLSLSTFNQNALYPYPNSSSFRLHEWFWNGGEKKTQAGFSALLDIIGDPNFRPCDVRNTNWHKIDKILGCADSKGNNWQFEDAGWLKASVTISIPFHRNTVNPGVRPFTICDFYHRNLTSVIRENLTDRTLARHFHYEPYELYWQPKSSDNPVRVQGELYTSPAFIEAHQLLQASPGEPSCDLPRVIVALMFCSDATHLTSFGNTKLWPLYLYFGNVSKYRRKKPSSHLCNHVAYFQKVENPPPNPYTILTLWF